MRKPAFTFAKSAGALIIGGDHPGLGIARSLGRRGIPVCVIDDEQSISAFSKYVSHFIRVKDLRDERCAVNAVLETGHRLGLKEWVLFPTRDETVAAFSRNRGELKEFFRVTTPAWKTIQWAWNKKKTYELAKQLSIPCPATVNPKGVTDLDTLQLQWPLAIKPAVKENFFYATKAKAWRAENIGQLRELYEKAARQIPAEEILIQEIIPGDSQRQVSYCAFFRDGQSHSVLVARRSRQHPYEFGRAATYVETINLPAIEELSERFLRTIHYYGLVEVEFKQDPRDGQYKLLDVNARTWGFHSIGFAAGVDFPYLLYADQVGESIKEYRAQAGIGWLRLVTDVPTAISQIFQGRLSARVYLQSLHAARIESVYCKEDLLPSFMEIALLPYLISKKYM